MSWQAYLRRLSKTYDVMVCGNPATRFLYNDFCSGYIPWEMTISDRDCFKGKIDPMEHLNLNKILHSFGYKRVTPFGPISMARQDFIKFGSHRSSLKYVVVHARSRQGRRPEASYPRESWDELMHNILDMHIPVYSVGTEAFAPYGTSSFCNEPLDKVIDIISGASLMIGPSSGPMHLASLCQTPHVVWTDKKYYSMIGSTNRERYERIWNPFNTECEVIDDQGWNPDPAYLFNRLLPRLEKLSNG